MDSCKDCKGHCCYKEKGASLLITADDINRLGRFLGLTDGNVRNLYMENRHSLLVQEDQSCIFFTPGESIFRCSVYEARPQQCQRFPSTLPCPYLNKVR